MVMYLNGEGWRAAGRLCCTFFTYRCLAIQYATGSFPSHDLKSQKALLPSHLDPRGARGHQSATYVPH